MVTLRKKGLVEPFPIDICWEFGKCNVKNKSHRAFYFSKDYSEKSSPCSGICRISGCTRYFFDKLERKILVCFFPGLSNLEISCVY